tara:strand:- start:451 stop:1461 length:1011 start_codon:yes stop_codon:yes gene_type:complete
MPNIPDTSVTFAFSERQERWTSRYSFTPTCYANCGDVMMSSKDGSGAWRHDTNIKRNNFYGEQFQSSLELVFNDYPSEVKVFNSVSIETNKNNWTARASTQSEHSNKNNQESALVGTSLEDKEGVKYFEIPKSEKNSTKNITPFPAIGSILNDDVYEEATEPLFQSFFTGFEISLPVNSLQLSNIPSLSVSGGQNFSEILVKSGDSLLGFDQFIQQEFPSFSPLVAIPFTGAQAGNNKEVQAVSIVDGAQSLVTFRCGRPISVEPAVIDIFIEAFKAFIESDQLFIKSKAKINGDNMRGPYMGLSLISLDDKPLELFSINVDYQLSSSAARLTQNP